MDVNESSSKKSWIQRRTRLEKYFLLIFAMLCIVIALLIVGVTCNSIGKCKTETETCQTQDCIKTANEILESIDETINPCENFYTFACSNSIKKLKIPEGGSLATKLTEIDEKITAETQKIFEDFLMQNESKKPFDLVKKLYKSCMDEDFIERNAEENLKKILRDLGGWPIIEEDSWDEEKFEWKKFVWDSRRMGLGVKYFLGFAVVTNLKNTSKHMLEITQPDFRFSREYLTTEEVKHYLNFIVDLAVTLGADKSKAETELKESLEFETKLSNFSLKPEEKINYTELFNPITIRELQKRYNKIDWLEYINKILEPEIAVDLDEVINLEEMNYVAEFEKLILETPKRVQANYAMLKVVQELLTYLPRKFTLLSENLESAILGITNSEPRWKKCSASVNQQFEPLTGALYVRKYFDRNIKDNVQQIVKYLKKAFIDNLNVIDWMDESTRINATEKAENIAENLAFPDELLDDNVLASYYKELNLSNDYLSNILKINIFDKNLEYRSLKQPVNRTQWSNHVKVATTEAYYHPVENSINVPAGILQGVFFSNVRPNYMNFGAIGSIIGHEITHGFDARGRQFGKTGNLENWWDTKTEQLFVNKTNCILNQYNNYTVEEINQNLNGLKTRDENIADNGGLKQAYSAYMEWKKDNKDEQNLPSLKYSPKQLFWISAAMNWCARYVSDSVLNFYVTVQDHAIEKFRVVGPFSNSEEFARDFNCPSGSDMNPIEKCSVW